MLTYSVIKNEVDKKMSNVKSAVKQAIIFDGSSEWEEFLKEVDSLIPQWGGCAKVYFFATSCGLESYKISKNKLGNFEWGNSRYVALAKNIQGFEPSLALKTHVSSAEELKKCFFEVNKLRAKCGCSIFISDGQEINIQVMSSKLKSWIEG